MFKDIFAYYDCVGRAYKSNFEIILTACTKENKYISFLRTYGKLFGEMLYFNIFDIINHDFIIVLTCTCTLYNCTYTYITINLLKNLNLINKYLL